LHRRQLLTGLLSSALLAQSWPVSSSVSTKLWRPRLGLQLFTVRNALQNNPQSVIKNIAEIGFQSIQGSSIKNAQMYRPIGEQYGLSMSSSHISIDDFITDTGQLKARAKDKIATIVKLKLKNIIISSPFKFFDSPPISKVPMTEYFNFYHQLANAIKSLSPMLREYGVSLSFHPHSVEFFTSNSTSAFEILKNKLSAEELGFEIDAFWASLAGQNPAELISSLGNRCNSLHLNDRAAEVANSFDAMQLFMNLPQASVAVGSGIIDFESVLSVAKAHRIENLYLEQVKIGNNYIEELKTSFSNSSKLIYKVR
jgi:sugar phosphate isomerase/epimerase